MVLISLEIFKKIFRDVLKIFFEKKRQQMLKYSKKILKNIKKL